eukprot:7010545-Alexandrium_andersonii.AAC.1
MSRSSCLRTRAVRPMLALVVSSQRPLTLWLKLWFWKRTISSCAASIPLLAQAFVPQTPLRP